jgi:HAD superfamily hydrolase (TIGR01509 family)
MLSALLWDVDGTLAETERDGHLVAFNKAFAAQGVPWRWDERRYGELLVVTGGRERLLHDMASHPDAPRDLAGREALAAALHAAKNEFYEQIVENAELGLRPGVRELLDDCVRARLRMGIVTTTSRSNVEALLRVQLGSGWRSWFEVVVTGEDVDRKKPDPQAYNAALAQLQLLPAEALAIEDSPAGARAATAAGVPVIVTRSHYFNESPTDESLACGPSLGRRQGWNPRVDAPSDWRIGLAQLRVWHSKPLWTH